MTLLTWLLLAWLILMVPAAVLLGKFMQDRGGPPALTRPPRQWARSRKRVRGRKVRTRSGR